MTPHARFLSVKSFGSLDGLRAISILAVVWHHTRPEPDPWVALSRGFLGVDLFFVISGFLIVTLLLRERDRTGGISLSSFYARRALRIFPLYYAVLLLCLAFALVSGSGQAAALRADLPWAAAYLTNWTGAMSLLAVTWSLAAEEQFYCAWPPLMRALGRWAPCALAAALAVTCGLQLAHGHLGLAVHPFLAQTSFFPILLGVALAYVLHDPRGHAAALRTFGGRHAPLVIGGWLVAFLVVAPRDLSGWPRLAVHLSLALFVGSCVVREDHAAARPLRLAVLARVGTLSYGIYLLHQFCRHVATKLLPAAEASGGLVLFLVTLGLTLVAAELSYRGFESRFLALKERFATAPRPPALTPVALPTTTTTTEAPRPLPVG